MTPSGGNGGVPLGGNVNIGGVTGRVVDADLVIGVRVAVTQVLPSGDRRVVSVVINARAGATIGDILQAAVDWFASGRAGIELGHAYGGTFSSPTIIQVVEGGLPGARLGVL